MKSENATIKTQSTKESTIQNSEKLISTNNNESFKVYIRIKPSIQKIIPNPKNSFIKTIVSPKNTSKNIILEKDIIKVDKNILYLEDIKNTKNKNNKIYIFDNIFNDTATNEIIFNSAIKSMIDKILLGYNSTALAYGVTGTGKTYTIFGDLSNNFKDEGIIFKACDYLFEKIELNKNINKPDDINNININYEIKVSYIEIYNEIIKDLINENSPSLMIVEDPLKGVICSNVKEVIIKDSIHLKKIINESNKRRTMASTDQNQFSSRSHAILQMTLEKKIKKSEDNYDIIYSKFLVVDLAGSERSLERGKRREEGVNINKSLFTLGNCLNILSEKSNTGKFVPYRDSKLTRILKDSLGGNILTVMLACISPCSSTYDETLNTLNYAFKAKKITKKVMKNIQEINVNNLQYKEMIDNLKNEIMQLKLIIKNQEIKLKEKVDINNTSENIGEMIDKEKNNYLSNIRNIKSNVSCENLETININNPDDDNKAFDNEQKTQQLSEREGKRICNTIDSNSINDINLDKYNKYIEDIINNNLDVNNIKYQIESITKDKNTIEAYLLKENNEDKNIINKYNLMKNIYDKYIELINEKLVENIEQNMIYNYNIKEITELNISNSNKIKELELQLKSDINNIKISEEIIYTKKNIIENNSQKEQIEENIKKNEEDKNELKKLLLNLLENKTNYSNDKFIHIIHEKDKLSKITKQYKEEIDNYVKLQKQKEEDLMKINRKVEILRAKLKEKDKKICELEKKGGKPKYEHINIKFFCNKNIKRENSNKNKRMKENIISPINKIKNNSSLNNKFFAMKKIENKNKKNDKNFKYKKDMTTVLSNESDKIDKKFEKNINRSQSIKLNKTTKIKSNYDLTKYNDLIIPTTTITLTEINPNEKENINPIYIKAPIKNKFKKTPKNENKIKYKFPIINNLNKRNSSNNHNIKIFQKDNKKLSVKSVKIDLLNNNNKSEINILPRKNSSEKSRKKNIINENNLMNIHEFKAEKIDIDLTEINKNNLDLNLDEIKNKQIKQQNDKKKEQTESIILQKCINNISKSNPKINLKQNKLKNFTKKLSLQEARLENKIKSKESSQPKNELKNVQSFINEYNTNKSKIYIKDKDKKNNEDKISVKTEPNIDKLSEKFRIYSKKRNKNKSCYNTIDSRKEKMNKKN